MDGTKEFSHGNKVNLSDYGFGMGLSFGTIFVIIIIVCVSWKCFFHMRAARRNAMSSTTTTTAAADANNTTTISKGLDEATILELPKLLYSEAKPYHDHRRSESISSGCSICLADYKDNHMIRQLPYCGHLFHVDCVDPWLRLQATCPICRDSPLFSGIHRRQLQS